MQTVVHTPSLPCGVSWAHSAVVNKLRSYTPKKIHPLCTPAVQPKGRSTQVRERCTELRNQAIQFQITWASSATDAKQRSLDANQLGVLVECHKGGQLRAPPFSWVSFPFHSCEPMQAKVTRSTDDFRHEFGAAHSWCVLDSCQRPVVGALVHPVCVPCVDCPQQTAQQLHRCRRLQLHPRRRTKTRSCGQGLASSHGHHHVRRML